MNRTCRNERRANDVARHSESSIPMRSVPREAMKTKMIGIDLLKERIVDRLTLVRRPHVGFLVAFASMALMLATSVPAQVKPGDSINPENASPPHSATAPHRTGPVEIQILRNGKSSESVSFSDEVAARNYGARGSLAHHEAASDDAAADAGELSTVARAPESARDHREMVAPPLNSGIAPATAPADASIKAPIDHTSTPRTIDLE